MNITAGGQRRLDVLAIGDPVLDVVVRTDALPRWDDKHLAHSTRLMPGGCEANAACAASQLGATTALFGQVGDGPEGELLLRDLTRFRVGTEHIQVLPGTTTATAVVHVSADGERAVSYSCAQPTASRWAELEKAISQASWIYLLPYDPQRARQIAALARKHRVAVAMDLERAAVAAHGSFQALSALADCFFFNEAGFTLAAQQPASVASARQLLHASAAHTVVVTLGSRGALAVNRSHQAWLQAAYPAVVRDTTGAGDCFNGAFLAACVRGDALSTALDQASAAASLCVQCDGARAGLPTWSELSAHRARHGAGLQHSEGFGPGEET